MFSAWCHLRCGCRSWSWDQPQMATNVFTWSWGFHWIMDYAWETIMSCTSSTLEKHHWSRSDSNSESRRSRSLLLLHPASVQKSQRWMKSNSGCFQSFLLCFQKIAPWDFPRKCKYKTGRRVVWSQNPPPTSVTPLPAAVSRVKSLHTTVHPVHTTHGPNTSLGCPQSTTPMFGIWALSPEATSAPRGSSIIRHRVLLISGWNYQVLQPRWHFQ